MKKLLKKLNLALTFLVIAAFTISVEAERVRLERESGVVNEVLQGLLVEQIGSLSGGVGKIELGFNAESKGACRVDLFVSPETVFTALELDKGRDRAEFYVDHPHDSFKDILFQALVKNGAESELSVDKKTGGYKFVKKGNELRIEVKKKGEIKGCSFDLTKAVLVSGETE